MKNNKPKLILLSDLFGKEKSNWIDNYTKPLENKFNIKYLDCCELGEIKGTDNSEEHIHKQFLNGGIEKAVENLILLEKDEIHILAFSIGGLIGWKASLSGLKIKSMIAISSTRLRTETEKPNIVIELFFGENDEFKPEDYWFEKLEIKKQIIKKEHHNFYQKPKIAKKITEILLRNLKTE